VVDLLALDTLNPRSVLYHLTEIRDHVAFLPNAEVNGQMSHLARAVLHAHTGLAVETPETIDGTALRALILELQALSDLLAASYLR
jgi:uncharacterized alpha-E superfamily protein